LSTHLIAFEFVEVVLADVKREEKIRLCCIGHLKGNKRQLSEL